MQASLEQLRTALNAKDANKAKSLIGGLKFAVSSFDSLNPLNNSVNQ